MDTKKQSQLLKNRAKELGYEIKLTHAQELVATVKGHKSRHSALIEDEREKLANKLIVDKLEPLLGKSSPDMVVNTLCQCCGSRPRVRATYIYSGNPQIWLLCDDCGAHDSSKFSPNHGAKDVSDSYDIHATYIRDVRFFNGDGNSTIRKAFMFRLILSNGELGDRYISVPGLWSGHSEVKVWNLDKNEEANGWWDWPILILPNP